MSTRLPTTDLRWPPNRILDAMVGMAAIIAASVLGLSQTPYVGIACRHVPDLTTCGRVGIGVWLKRPAQQADAVLLGTHVRLRAGGLGGKAPRYWQGYAHIDRRRLRLPRQWFGNKPIRFVRLRLTIRDVTGTRSGSVRVVLHPGWG